MNKGVIDEGVRATGVKELGKDCSKEFNIIFFYVIVDYNVDKLLLI